MKRLRQFAYPYLVWMGIFIVVPTCILLFLAFSDFRMYASLRVDGFQMTLKNFQVFMEAQVVTALWNSLKLSFITTLVCFIIGYPVALYLTSLSTSARRIWLALLIVPLWSNMILRIMAWEKVFTPNSFFTNVFGLSFDLLGTETAVIIGMIAMYLPFMIFPIFSVLEKMDPSLLEASKDLGANDLQTFLRVIFPLSSGGVISGVIMTMLPAMTSFALPARLGYGKISLIGNIIESKFRNEVSGSSGLSINQGSILALLLMVFSVISFVLITRVDKEGETLI